MDSLLLFVLLAMQKLPLPKKRQYTDCLIQLKIRPTAMCGSVRRVHISKGISSAARRALKDSGRERAPASQRRLPRNRPALMPSL